MKQSRVKVPFHLLGPGSGKIQGFLLYRQHSFAVTLTWKHFDSRKGFLYLAPLLRQVEHASKSLKFAVDAADFHTSGFANSRESSNCLRGDGVQAGAGEFLKRQQAL